jgi:hypothetical protein
MLDSRFAGFSCYVPRGVRFGGETPAVHHAVSSVPTAKVNFHRGLLDYYAHNPKAAEHEFYTAADLSCSSSDIHEP